MNTDNKDSNDKPEDNSQFAIINEQGEEIPITEEMIEESFASAKPNSIGKHTIPGMPIITDDMLEDNDD